MNRSIGQGSKLFRHRRRMSACILALALACLCVSRTAVAVDDARPNFLVIVTDDQGWWDLPSHGNPVLKTPTLEKLRADGVEFTRFYTSPVCSLTRASLLTGRYPLRTGCYDTRFGHDTLAADEITLADMLKRAGYRTALFGKWHQGRYMASHPNNRGFDEFFGFWQYGHVERYFYPDRMWHNQERVECRGHITELITEAAINYVTSAKQPFLCLVTYNVPHYPLQAPPDLVKKYLAAGIPLDDAQMYAMLEHCDANIGRLLEAMDEHKLSKNTVVVFLSDNGGVSQFFRAGLRGGKGSVHEGGILVPGFVRYPGKFPAGKKIDAPVGVIDIFPTLLELAGATPPADRTIDGKSLVPLLKAGAGKSPHEYLYHNWSRDLPRDDVKWAISNTQYKLNNGQLFDILQDPGEKKDLAAKLPEVVKTMRQEYVRWFRDVTAGREYGRVRIEVGRPDENPTELQMSWAALHGKSTHYTFDAYDWDIVDGWNAPGDAVDWDLTVVEPGKYAVTLSYGCSPADAGGKFEVSAANRALEGSVEPSPTANTFLTRTIGALELPAGETTLRIEAKSVPGKQLMALNRVWLKRLD